MKAAPAARRQRETVTMTAVLFDLDGTLADTLDDLADAMNHVLAGLGLPTHARDAYRRFVGSGVQALAARVLPPGHAALRDEVVAAFERRYADHACERTTLYPGVPALLDALAALGVPTAVLSNKPDPFTTAMVAELLARWSFASVAGARPDAPRKPDPTVALAMARTLGVAPERCLFVGDSDVDMETARNAGMIPVGASWGFRGPEELRRAGASHVIDRPEDVLALLPRP